MADALRKFHNRAFRYVLRTQDDRDMRFALERAGGVAGVEQTLLLNLSETGCAFLVDGAVEIAMNERIKVEIPVPQGAKIAWWGRVVRIEEHEPASWRFSSDAFRGEPKIKIGVRFDPLPEGHSRALRKGLEQSFMKAMRDQHYRNWLYYRAVVLQNLWKALLIIGLAAAAGAALYVLSLPSGNYTSERGAPWGERRF